MTSIQGHGHHYRKRTSKDPLGSSLLLEFSHDKAPVSSLAVGSSEPLIAKYIEKDLQIILRTVLEAQALPFDRPRKKPLKTRSTDINCDKSHIEYYNFCQ